MTLTGRRITCGSETLEPGESCDDGNRTAGDGCDAWCQVERCFACAGLPSICAPTPGASCDDGAACTTGDTCAGAVCAGTPLPDGTSCDADGNVCTGTAACQAGSCQPGPPPACGACEQCDAVGGCVTGPPRSTCTPATNLKRTTLAIRNTTTAERDTVAFRWTYGPDAAVGVSFGDPLNTDSYGLCVFDESTAAPALVLRAIAPAGGTCDGRPCWRGPFASPSYRDRDATPDGLTSLGLQGGSDRAKVSLKGKGTLLSSRPFGLPGLPLSLPLLVQLQNARGGCVEARFDAAGVTKNDPAKGRFKARATP